MTNSDSKNTILCVDDETTSLMVRKMLLDSQGYRTLAAKDGQQALSIFAAEAVDLVMLDYMMDGMNGGEVAERIKQVNPSVPVLLLSAYVDLPQQILSLVDKYLTKGEGPAVMLATVAELLTDGRPRSHPATPPSGERGRTG